MTFSYWYIQNIDGIQFITGRGHDKRGKHKGIGTRENRTIARKGKLKPKLKRVGGKMSRVRKISIINFSRCFGTFSGH